MSSLNVDTSHTLSSMSGNSSSMEEEVCREDQKMSEEWFYDQLQRLYEGHTLSHQERRKTFGDVFSFIGQQKDLELTIHVLKRFRVLYEKKPSMVNGASNLLSLVLRLLRKVLTWNELPHPATLEAITQLFWIMGQVGQVHLSVKDLRRILSMFSRVVDGTYDRLIGESLAVSLLAMAHRKGPSSVFEFSGTDSAIVVPIKNLVEPKGWPFPKGYTFCTWLYYEEPQNQLAADSILLSFLTGEGNGLEIALTSQNHALKVTVRNHVGQYIMFVPPQAVSLHPKTWYSIAVVHTKGKGFRGKAICSVFINGRKCFESNLPLPEKLANPLTFCSIGARVLPKSIREIPHQPFLGQLGSIYFFGKPLSPEQLWSLFSRGPDHTFNSMTLSSSTSSESNWFKSFVSNPMDTLVSSLSRKDTKVQHGYIDMFRCLSFLYHPKCIQNQRCLDVAPAFSPSRIYLHGRMASSVNCSVTNHLWDIIQCMPGGLNVLFPILQSIDSICCFEPSDADQKQTSDVKCVLPVLLRIIATCMGESVSLQRSMLEEDTIATLGYLLANAVSSRHLVPSCVDAVGELCRVSSWLEFTIQTKADTPNIFSGVFLRNQLLRLTGTQAHEENVMLDARKTGWETNPALKIDFASKRTLFNDCFTRIVLNLDIWMKEDMAIETSTEMVRLMNAHIQRQPGYFRRLIPVPLILNHIRTHLPYQYKESKHSLLSSDAADDASMLSHVPSPEMMKVYTIRSHLMTSIRLLALKDLDDEDALRQDVQSVVDHLIISRDRYEAGEVLDLILDLIYSNTAATCNALTACGVPIVLVNIMIKFPCSFVHTGVLHIVSSILRYHSGWEQANRGMVQALGQCLSHVPLVRDTYLALLELLLGYRRGTMLCASPFKECFEAPGSSHELPQYETHLGKSIALKGIIDVLFTLCNKFDSEVTPTELLMDLQKVGVHSASNAQTLLEEILLSSSALSLLWSTRNDSPSRSPSSSPQQKPVPHRRTSTGSATGDAACTNEAEFFGMIDEIHISDTPTGTTTSEATGTSKQKQAMDTFDQLREIMVYSFSRVLVLDKEGWVTVKNAFHILHRSSCIGSAEVSELRFRYCRRSIVHGTLMLVKEMCEEDSRVKRSGVLHQNLRHMFDMIEEHVYFDATNWRHSLVSTEISLEEEERGDQNALLRSDEAVVSGMPSESPDGDMHAYVEANHTHTREEEEKTKSSDQTTPNATFNGGPSRENSSSVSTSRQAGANQNSSDWTSPSTKDSDDTWIMFEDSSENKQEESSFFEDGNIKPSAFCIVDELDLIQLMIECVEITGIPMRPPVEIAFHLPQASMKALFHPTSTSKQAVTCAPGTPIRVLLRFLMDLVDAYVDRDPLYDFSTASLSFSGILHLLFRVLSLLFYEKPAKESIHDIEIPSKKVPAVIWKNRYLLVIMHRLSSVCTRLSRPLSPSQSLQSPSDLPEGHKQHILRILELFTVHFRPFAVASKVELERNFQGQGDYLVNTVMNTFGNKPRTHAFIPLAVHASGDIIAVQENAPAPRSPSHEVHAHIRSDFQQGIRRTSNATPHLNDICRNYVLVVIQGLAATTRILAEEYLAVFNKTSHELQTEAKFVQTLRQHGVSLLQKSSRICDKCYERRMTLWTEFEEARVGAVVTSKQQWEEVIRVLNEYEAVRKLECSSGAFWALDGREDNHRMRRRMSKFLFGSEHKNACKSVQDAPEDEEKKKSESGPDVEEDPTKSIAHLRNLTHTDEEFKALWDNTGLEEDVVSTASDDAALDWDLMDNPNSPSLQATAVSTSPSATPMLAPKEDPSNSSSAFKKKRVRRFSAKRILPYDTVQGSFHLYRTHISFEPDAEVDPAAAATDQAEVVPALRKLRDSTRKNTVWYLHEIRAIYRRRYKLQRIALEIFFVDGTTLFVVFASVHERNVALKRAVQLPMPNVILPYSRPAHEILERSKISERWQKRGISNFDYLMYLNTLSGRTYNDLNQYPVFPWILTDYRPRHLMSFASEEERIEARKEFLDVLLCLDAENPRYKETFRDLSKPIGALNEDRLQHILDRLNSLNDTDIPPFHYGSHYSNAGIVLYYLIRLEPFASLHIDLQGGRFDYPDRLFSSLHQTWRNCQVGMSCFKELIPEFFYLPEFLENLNAYHFGSKQDADVVSQVQLPWWCNDAQDFIRIHRLALESEYVSNNLPKWIDLIFGYKQRGKEAMKAHNLFYHLTYEGAVNLDHMEDPVLKRAVEEQIALFGQTPAQLFLRPHPSRVLLSQANDSLSVERVIHSLPNPHNQIYESALFCSQAVPPEYRHSILLLSPLSNSGEFLTGSSAFSLGLHEWKRSKDRTGQAVYSYVCKGFTRQPDILPIRSCMTFSDCGTFVFVGNNWDDSLRLYRVVQEKARLPELHLQQQVSFHKGRVSCVCLEKAEEYVASASQDCCVAIWKLIPQSGLSIQSTPHRVLRGHEDRIIALDLDAAQDICISVSARGVCLMHSIITGLFLRELRLPCEGGEIPHLLTISPLGQIFFFAQTSSVQAVNGSGLLLSCSINGHYWQSAQVESPVTCMTLFKEGHALITAHLDGSLHIRDRNTLLPIFSYEKHHCALTSLRLTKGILMMGTEEGEVRIVTLKPLQFVPSASICSP